VVVQALRVGSAITCGLATLAVLSRVMGIAELNDAAAAVVRRVRPSLDT
jgi:hypothetical protein